MVVSRIETEGDDIALRKVVAAAKARADLRRVSRIAMSRDVEIPIVVRDLDDGAFGRRLQVVGLFLHEVFDRLRVVPHLVVQPSVDPRRGAADPERMQFLARLLGNHRLRARRGPLAETLAGARDHATRDRLRARSFGSDASPNLGFLVAPPWRPERRTA